MTQAESRRIIAMVAARYPTPAMTQETLLLWAEIIADLDFTAAQQAAMAWFRSSEQRLDPAELRRQVASLHADGAGSPYLSPDDAWGFVVQCITRVGQYRPFPEAHPLVAEAVAALGWETLCRSDNTVADRAHFTQLYRARLERAKREDATNPGAAPLAAMGQRPAIAGPSLREIA